MKYCNFNGCKELIAKGYYCDNHKRSEKSKRRLRNRKEVYHHENKSFYNSKLWKDFRQKIYQREKGLCQQCKKFVFGRNAHIHHIVPVKEDGSLKLDENNVMLCCRYCHMELENGDKKKVHASYFDFMN